MCNAKHEFIEIESGTVNSHNIEGYIIKGYNGEWKNVCSECSMKSMEEWTMKMIDRVGVYEFRTAKFLDYNGKKLMELWFSGFPPPEQTPCPRFCKVVADEFNPGKKILIETESSSYWTIHTNAVIYE